MKKSKEGMLTLAFYVAAVAVISPLVGYKMADNINKDYDLRHPNAKAGMVDAVGNRYKSLASDNVIGTRYNSLVN